MNLSPNSPVDPIPPNPPSFFASRVTRFSAVSYFL
jgi:hypothetical protein